MRLYMPPAHRRFLEAVEARSRVRAVVQASGDADLRAVYNACVDGVQRFRALHLEYAAQYIYKQQAKDAKNPTRVGTGGTPFMKYLKKHRDESGAHRLE